MYEGAFCPCVKNIVVKLFRIFAFNVRHAFISASSIKQNSFFFRGSIFLSCQHHQLCTVNRPKLSEMESIVDSCYDIHRYPRCADSY